MKVLLYSHAFHPSLGGVETVSLALARGFLDSGVECKVVTQTPAGKDDVAFGFEVVRQPGRQTARSLVRWADVVLFNGASLALQPWVILTRKPFVWVHVGYQAACIDGLGWVDNAPAPITPLRSIRFHARRSGWLYGAKEGVKLMLRRAVATFVVDRNIAITHWMYKALPLPRQTHIYNPFPIEQFRNADNPAPEFEFFYMGRMVQEKGVDVLLRAFAEVCRRRPDSTARLLLIGDGGARPDMERLVKEFGLSDSIVFAGRQSGASLVEWTSKGRIGILPSTWFEPMGGVAVELMAAGKSLIVSEAGGLAECVGDAGMVFPNGDHMALADRMLTLLDNPEVQLSQSERARQRASSFLPSIFVSQYIEMLEDVIGKR